MSIKEKEALEIVKRTNNGGQLTALVDDMDLPKKVRLEIAKRKDSTAYRAKLALTDKMYTEEDILWMLIDDSNSDVSARAFTALCDRMTMTSAGIKDKDVRDDFIEYIIDFGEKTKMKDYHLSKRLMQQCLKFSKHPEVVKALKKLMAMAGMIRLNESDDSNLLEASYILLAQQTESQTQLQKLAESQFESVREIAKAAIANLQSMNEAVDVTSFTIEKTANMKTASEKLKVFKALVSQSQSVSSNGNECEVKKNGMTVNFALVSYSSGGLHSLDLVYRVNGGEKMSVGLGEWEDNDEVQKQKVINDANKQVSFLKIKVDGDKYRANRWY